MENNQDAVAAKIYEDGVLVIVAGRLYFVPFEEYKVLKEANSGDIFNVEYAGGIISWPSLSLDVSVSNIEIVAPEETYKYPKMTVCVTGGAVVLGTILVIFSGASVFFVHETNPDQIFYARICLVLFTAACIYILFLFVILMQTIKINREGITQKSPGCKEVSIPWNRIQKLKKLKFDNCLKIVSEDGASILVNSSLQGYENLMYYILAKTGLTER